jgi:hypothetical protein
VLGRYRATSGRDLDDIDYYHAFALWRLACISNGVVARYTAGAMGDHGVDLAELARQPDILTERAHAVLDGAVKVSSR